MFQIKSKFSMICLITSICQPLSWFGCHHFVDIPSTASSSLAPCLQFQQHLDDITANLLSLKCKTDHDLPLKAFKDPMALRRKSELCNMTCIIFSPMIHFPVSSSFIPVHFPYFTGMESPAIVITLLSIYIAYHGCHGYPSKHFTCINSFKPPAILGGKCYH